MSGLEVFGAVGAAIALVDKAKDAFQEIRGMRFLPETFKQIPPKVDLVRQMLVKINDSKDDTTTNAKAVAPVAKECQLNIERLVEILHKLRLEDFGSRTRMRPTSLTSTPRSSAPRGKKGRVEDLLQSVLQDIMLLANNHVIHSIGQAQAVDLEWAIEDLKTAEPSITEDYLPEEAGSQHISIGGYGSQHNQIGNNNHSYHGSGNIFSGSHGTYNIGGGK